MKCWKEFAFHLQGTNSALQSEWNTVIMILSHTGYLEMHI